MMAQTRRQEKSCQSERLSGGVQRKKYVIATGKYYSVREFAEECYMNVGIKIKWIGKGLKEIGINNKNKEKLIIVDSKYFRPNEVDELKGDTTKARNKLKWKPKTSFKKLVKEMIEHEIKFAS